ncbi:MarR family winged helix-turn-helix transcriptional regulator [Agrococcus jejuensis]|uniref:DNA-binding transcriptional regulator, MarR family n=1 Tax=Agrococcus jejuensis TaxID=399736 RepID=A0A1G8DQ67_9MICO|nr:MarR family transcriptional regulator [Agrococcus jejuensis]SDH59570.1 DNA-binding transcriptional regulator, MarR family [Agrococcus jejuensis]
MDFIVDPLIGRPETDVVQALTRLRTAESHMMRRRQAMQGLGESDGAALRLIVERYEDEPVTPTDVATHLGLTTSAVTSLVDRLVKAGLIETLPHPTDRRRKVIMPTDAALAVDPLEAHVQELVEELSTRSRLLVVGFLDRVAMAIEREAR